MGYLSSPIRVCQRESKHFNQLLMTRKLQKAKPIDLREVMLKLVKLGKLYRMDWTDGSESMASHQRENSLT